MHEDIGIWHFAMTDLGCATHQLAGTKARAWTQFKDVTLVFAIFQNHGRQRRNETKKRFSPIDTVHFAQFHILLCDEVKIASE
jgi:hypothetical protein